MEALRFIFETLRSWFPIHFGTLGVCSWVQNGSPRWIEDVEDVEDVHGMLDKSKHTSVDAKNALAFFWQTRRAAQNIMPEDDDDEDEEDLMLLHVSTFHT